MAIKRLGAQRFAGLAADVASLPINADLVGAIFDATDTIQKFVFDGTTWQEFVSGTGEDNTGANVGAGTGTIFRDKIGVVLNFKTLIGGDNITVTDNADDVTITSTGTSPLTTKGDLYGFTTVDERIPVGTDGQVLTADASQPIGIKWSQPIPLTTKGDLLSVDAGIINSRLPVGSDGQILQANSSEGLGLEWVTSSGGITGLNPNSTILDHSTDIAEYTSPDSASATSEDGANVAANAVDGNTGTFWQSLAGVNESITIVMASGVNDFALAYFISSAQLSSMTETQFQIKGNIGGFDITGLAAYWKFDESSGDIINQSGASAKIANADLVVTGATHSATGIIDFGLSFNGSSNFASPSNSALTDWDFLHTSGGKFSVNIWVNYSVISGTQEAVGNLDGNTATNGFRILVTSGGAITVDISNNLSGAPEVNVTTSGTISTGFHMISVTFDDAANILTVNIDGGTREVFSSLTPLNATATSVDDLTIASGQGIFFSNMIADEFSLWDDRLLTAAEEIELYNSGAALALPTTLPTSRILRTINTVDLVPDVYNFIRFNGINASTITIEGSSGNSLVMAANDLQVLLETDPPLTILHGQFTISGTNENLGLNGGDPTSSVIDDPATNSMTLVSTVEQNDPPTDGMVMWNEILDANNSVTHSKMKIDGAIKNVRWF